MPVMDADEQLVYNYLKTFGEDWVNAKEVCRRADSKRRFAEDPHWARPALQQLKDHHVLEADMSGRYRIKPEKKEKHKGHWMSPDIEKILRESGIQADTDRADAAAGESHGQS